jgi:hydrogenase/urease accessory protein HupE
VTIDGLPGSITDVLARVERSDGTTQVARLLPERPRFVVESPQDGVSVAWTYTTLGVHHILSGIDHLLYILAMLFLVTGWRRILATMTAFTATHSLTLSAAALGWVHVPQPPVEACIALSIVFVAREIVETRHGRPGLTARWPWVVSFTFGLMHGFGFAGALAEVGLPTKAIPIALLFFNVGVEIGQIVFVASVLAASAVLMRLRQPRVAWVRAVPPYVIGAIAMFWVIARVIAFTR